MYIFSQLIDTYIDLIQINYSVLKHNTDVDFVFSFIQFIFSDTTASLKSIIKSIT